MSEMIVAMLKKRVEGFASHEAIGPEALLNILKEALQFYVLDFIYHHPTYSAWIMYGGSALRIIHGLDRMSVDLDFEISHTISDPFLEKLKKDIADHFTRTYGAGADFLTVKIINGRGLLLKFLTHDDFIPGYASKQVHVKIDLNHFVAPKTVTERRPINSDQLSFVVVTYNMSALMASKIAAIFLRGTRGVGKAIYAEKGRDIYDLLWYMGKKTLPDFDYLVAKGIDVTDPRALFDKLTLCMNKVSDENLRQDLLPLFVDRTFIEHWLQNWKESYRQLLDDYRIRHVTELKQVAIHHDFLSDNYSFVYWYRTEEGETIRITCTVSGYWIRLRDGDLEMKPQKILEDTMTFSGLHHGSRKDLRPKLKQYATLFHQKTERYFKKTNGVMLGDSIMTKVILMSPDPLNPKEQMWLNKSTLLSCELDDLLK